MMPGVPAYRCDELPTAATVPPPPLSEWRYAGRARAAPLVESLYRALLLRARIEDTAQAGGDALDYRLGWLESEYEMALERSERALESLLAR